MTKFETINGTLCRMVEPTPLTPEATFPCMVRLIQDDSPMGRYNRDAAYSDAIGKLFVAQKIKENPFYSNTLHAYEKNSLNQDYCIASIHTLEVIGYPVEEGSRWWALYQMMQGHEVCNSDIHGGAERFAVRDGRIVHHVRNAFEDYCAVDSQFFPPAGLSTGWKLHKEPEPQYKVGDWVDCKDLAGVHAQCKVLEIHKHNVILGCKTGHRWSLPHNNIIRKISPSEIVVRIGCLSGTVSDYFDSCIELTHDHDSECSSLISITALDAQTRELVESLLKAQEEEE